MLRDLLGMDHPVLQSAPYGLAGFTSGCVCIRPDLSARMLSAANDGQWEVAESIREIFRPLEDHRNQINPIRVLHEAVALAGIAKTGPLIPCLSDLDPSDRTLVADAAMDLLRNRSV